jgi:hypothetical protein
MKRKLFLLFLFLASCSQTNRQTEVYKIPFYFVTSSASPIIDVEIAGVQYPFELDWGLVGSDIAIRPEVLEKISSKQLKGTSRQFDFKGNLYKSNHENNLGKVGISYSSLG